MTLTTVINNRLMGNHQPGKFFDGSKGELPDINNLLAGYGRLLRSIGDKQPNINAVKDFFEIVNKSLDSIIGEINWDNPAPGKSMEERAAIIADIKHSMVFKLNDVLYATHSDAMSDQMNERDKLNSQSPILIHLARKFFVETNVDLSSSMKEFYERKYQGVLDYSSSRLETLKIANNTEISNQKELAEVMELDSKVNFNALPKTYKEKLLSALWKQYLSAPAGKHYLSTPAGKKYLSVTSKKNLYPISLVDFDDTAISELSKVKTATVESMADTMTDRPNFNQNEIDWMKGTFISKVDIGADHHDKDSIELPYFELRTKDTTEVGLKVSARAPTNMEFRGDLLREIFINVQSGKPKTVYDAFQEHIRHIQHNGNLKMLINVLTNGVLAGKPKGFLSDFDAKTTVYEAVRVQVSERLSKFFEQYSEALATYPDLLIENVVVNGELTPKLTPKGKEQCEAILMEINALHPLPDDLVIFLNANREFEQKLATLSEQISSGNPFKPDSEEHKALKTLHESLDKAHRHLKYADPVSLPNNGGSRIYEFGDFRTECEKAFLVAEESALKHHRGWLDNILKPIIACVLIVCTLGAALVFESVEKTVRALIMSTTDAMKTVTAFKRTLRDIKSTPAEPGVADAGVVVDGSLPTKGVLPPSGTAAV